MGTIKSVIIMMIIAGVVGAIAKGIVGLSRSGCLASIAIGLVGAMLGSYIAKLAKWPDPILLQIGSTPFPLIWSIVGSVLFVGVVVLLTGRKHR